MSAEPDVYEGPDGVRRYFESFWDIVDGLTFELVAIEDAGDWTLVSVHPHGAGHASRLPVEDHIALSVQAHDGRLTRLRTHPGMKDACAWVAEQVS